MDVVVRESAAVLKLLAGENQSLLVGRDPLLVLKGSFKYLKKSAMRSYLDFGFDIFDRVGWFHFEGNGLAGESFDKDLHRVNFAGSETDIGDCQFSCQTEELPLRVTLMGLIN